MLVTSARVSSDAATAPASGCRLKYEVGKAAAPDLRRARQLGLSAVTYAMSSAPFRAAVILMDSSIMREKNPRPRAAGSVQEPVMIPTVIAASLGNNTSR